MCQMLWVDGKPLSFGEMVKLAGRRKVVLACDDYGTRTEFFRRSWDSCLCGVDLKATGEAAGFVATEHESGDYYTWKRP